MADRRLRVLALCALALTTALAGCIGGDDEATEAASVDTPEADDPTPREGTDGTAGTNNGTEPEAPMQVSPPDIVHLPSCDQFHLFYASSASDWDPYLPEGFVVYSEDDLTVNVIVFVNFCTEGHFFNLTSPAGGSESGDVTFVNAFIPVVPPQELNDAQYELELLPLALNSESQRLADQQRQWGLDAFVFDVEVGYSNVTGAPDTHVETVTIEGGGWSQTIDSAVTQDNEEWPGLTMRYWTWPGEGAVTGYIHVDWIGGVNLGLGQSLYRSVGDPEAPPAHSGLSHRVDDVEVVFTYHPLAAA